MVTRTARRDAEQPAPATLPHDPPKRSFRERMHLAREDAIVQAVNRLLAEKGFDAMTVDEVAAEVGIAKASLYRHFPSKEDLAAAAMVRVLERASAYLDSLDERLPAMEKLKSVAKWTMQVHLAGEMPSLPSQNSTLRSALTQHEGYLALLNDVSERLGRWIEAAQRDGGIARDLPPVVVLFTLYARACDPVLGFMQGTGQYSDEQIVELVMRTCFHGLGPR